MSNIPMKEKPILFSGAMVRALLDGSKTQTRRLVTPQPSLVHLGLPIKFTPQDEKLGRVAMVVPCAYGAEGEQIWVRETFFAYGRWETRYSEKKKRDEWHFIDMTVECGRVYQYAADNPDVPLATGRGGSLPGWHKRPAIFMPRAVSRIQNVISKVSVERLNSIAEQDCRAEGALGGHGSIPGYNFSATPREHFQHIWKSTCGDWDANPWVWVVEFRRVTP